MELTPFANLRMLDPRHMGLRSRQPETVAAGMGDTGDCSFPTGLAFLKTSDAMGMLGASRLRNVPFRDPKEPKHKTQLSHVLLKECFDQVRRPYEAKTCPMGPLSAGIYTGLSHLP